MSEMTVMTRRKQYIAAFLIFILSSFIQYNLFLHYDVLWSFFAANHLLQNGNYFHDFFDNKPPLIFYLSFPPLLFSKLMSLSLVFSERCWIFLFSIFSWLSCDQLLRRAKYDPKKHAIFMISLAFCYGLLPANILGESEYWLVILSMPYFLLLWQRYQLKKISGIAAFFIGFFGSLGFCLKPYFLIAPFFLEIYGRIRFRSRWHFFRIETVVLLGVIVSYGMVIFLITPEYVYYVLPLLWKFYVSIELQKMSQLINLNITLFTLVILASYALIRSKIHDKTFLDLLSIASFGFLFSFLIQGRAWFYHAFPMVTFAFLLAVVLGEFIVATDFKQSSVRMITASLLIGLSLLGIVLNNISMIYRGMVAYHSPRSYNRQFIAYVEKHAHHQPIAFWGTTVDPAPTVAYYSGVSLASRFASLWLVTGMVALDQDLRLSYPDWQRLQSVKSWLRQAMTEDLIRYQPSLVFVDTMTEKHYLDNKSFDYVRFLKEDPHFIKVWRHYRYQKTLMGFAIYARVIAALRLTSLLAMTQDGSQK